ncbi:hypothetical protein MKEN_00221300 [Mycena kentingensis (nom. inval.)]|nr:hypothetical protein MKEN_00221300 [Mycena kentingensis (nom. inval.)]
MLALRTQLERAGKANLHLSVLWGDSLRGYNLGHFCALLRHALTHAERITELTISFESLNNTRIFGYFTATEFPALSKFGLSTLEQDNLHPFSRYAHLSLPWYQISVLCVEVSCGDDLEMLRAAAHSLVQCTLKLAKQYGPVWGSGRPGLGAPSGSRPPCAI